MSTFSKRLRELRKEKQLSGEELGKIFNVTKTAISYWENGKTFPDELTIKQISDYFNVSLDYLLGRSNIRNPYKEDKEEKTTIAAHGNYDELPDESKKQVDSYIEWILSQEKKSD